MSISFAGGITVKGQAERRGMDGTSEACCVAKLIETENAAPLWRIPNTCCHAGASCQGHTFQDIEVNVQDLGSAPK